jgi:hypothetical protein
MNARADRFAPERVTGDPAQTRRRARAIAALIVAAGVLVGCANTATPAPPRTPSEPPPASPGAPAAADPGTGTTADTIAATTATAIELLAALPEGQRSDLEHDIDDEGRGSSWSNLPPQFAPRTGVNLDDLDDELRGRALAVVEALLSESGYATVTEVMAADAFLRDSAPAAAASLGEYYLAFYGEPSASSTWAVQLSGHHLGLNATLDGANRTVSFAPTHLGTQPAVYVDVDGVQRRPLGSVFETAFIFFDSLTPDQRARLVRSEAVEALSCEPAAPCAFVSREGLDAAELNAPQRGALLDVIGNWVGLADDEAAGNTLARIEASLDDTTVRWGGATLWDTTRGDGISFQIAGPDVFIEFANQSDARGADVPGTLTSGWGHVHTIYRDPAREDGGAPMEE